MADRIVPEKAGRTPDWEECLWNSLRLELWKCVALSLNINPNTVDVIEDPFTGTVRFEIENENVSVAFHLRLREARERLGSNGGLSHPRYSWMSLPDFAACARGWRWDMPPEMREMADIPAWVHEFGVRARADKQKTPTTAEGNANMEDEQVAIKADRAHTEKRTGAATVTREHRKANRLEDLKRFIEHVYEALDKAGHEIGQSGDRTRLPVSAGHLYTLFLLRHPEHKVARATFDDDLGKIARVKPGPKRYQIKELAEMLGEKFSVD